MEIINNKLVVSYSTTLHTFTRGEIKMKEGQGKVTTLAIEVKDENGGEKKEQDFSKLNAPSFMVRKTAKEIPTRKGELKNIKVQRTSQNNWDLLRKLDELVGLILAGEEPVKADIRYIITNNDKYRKERIKGSITVTK